MTKEPSLCLMITSPSDEFNTIIAAAEAWDKYTGAELMMIRPALWNDLSTRTY